MYTITIKRHELPELDYTNVIRYTDPLTMTDDDKWYWFETIQQNIYVKVSDIKDIRIFNDSEEGE